MKTLLCCFFLMSLLLVGCVRRQPDSTPEGAAKEFLERFEQVRGDIKETKLVVQLLSQNAQANLIERAKRASSALGKRMTPEQMLVPSYFVFRFEPRRWQTKLSGKRAIVEITGPQGELAEIPCVQENGKWRIDLVLPALPPIEKRPPTIEKR